MEHGNLDINTAKGLDVLRQRIKAAKIPSSKLDETINIATWNIREFGKVKRLKPSVHFIAEVLGQFDLIAIIELRNDISDLKRVMDILGPYWKVVYSDYIADAGGNRERIGYLYDQRAVTFTGMAAEADAPRKKDKTTGEYLEQISWWRRPYIASFRAGSFDFLLISAHIRWGDSAEGRIPELKLLADWVAKKKDDATGEDKDIIVMGDFNIPKQDDELYKAITSEGLEVPKAIRGLAHGSNLEKNKRYDQILHFPTFTKSFTDKAGVLDFYDGDHKKLYPGTSMSKADFTYQMSDHLPLWIQVDVDVDDEKLDQILNR
jgi:endonuclease/exonuclease/phosphatase family metal-dependent hydrolase